MTASRWYASRSWRHASGPMGAALVLTMVVALVLAVALHPVPAAARTVTILPSIAAADEEFEAAANALQPGDTLQLRGGVYSQTGRRAITCVGRADAPIVIRAMPGESALLTRPAEQIDVHNNLEIVGSRHLVLENLRLQGGSCGIRVIASSHVRIEGCEIFETGNNALALNSGTHTYESFVIRRNHIHHTGLSVSGPTEGEGMYLGCNEAACRVVDSTIEENYIHHLRATSDGGNDGIELKPGSRGNVIRKNVVHDTNIGRQYPGIFVYGGGSPPNVVEGNAVWNAGEAIQVVSDAVVRNNLLLNSSVAGITAAPHGQVPAIRNVTIVNNTIFGCPTGIYVRWAGAGTVTLANNAIYAPGGTAVDAAGLEAAEVRANYVDGRLVGAALDNAAFFAGGSAAVAFTNPTALEFWPRIGSPLRGMAQGSLAPASDFNDQVRSGPYDVGAYETEGRIANPGPRIAPGVPPSRGGHSAR